MSDSSQIKKLKQRIRNLERMLAAKDTHDTYKCNECGAWYLHNRWREKLLKWLDPGRNEREVVNLDDEHSITFSPHRVFENETKLEKNSKNNYKNY